MWRWLGLYHVSQHPKLETIAVEPFDLISGFQLRDTIRFRDSVFYIENIICEYLNVEGKDSRILFRQRILEQRRNLPSA